MGRTSQFGRTLVNSAMLCVDSVAFSADKCNFHSSGHIFPPLFNLSLNYSWAQVFLPGEIMVQFFLL